MKRFLLALFVIAIAVWLISKNNMNASNTSTVQEQLQRFSALIEKAEIVNKEVSQVSVGWHLDHMLITINKITDTLQTSNPEDYNPNNSFGKIMSLTANYIPRGMAKSPKVVRPPEVLLKDDILTHLTMAQENLKLLDTLNDDVYFNHPYFGDLKKSQAIRFLEVHTNHHLKIIRDILAP